MIQRNSKEVGFQGGNQVAQYTQAGGGYKGPEVQRSFGDDGAAATSNLVQNILKDADSFFKTGIQVSREEAYLSGAAAAASGEVEEELNTSILTKDWATAGFRDTAGKLKMADAEADMARNMRELRGESPEAMRQYLEKRRASLQPSLDGMSREQRVSAFGQMLTSDRAAIALHGVEHTKFIIEKKIETKQAEHAVNFSALENARKSGVEGAYNTALESYIMATTGSILNEPSFDPKMKQDMFVAAMEEAIGSGNVQVWDRLQGTKIPKDMNNPTGERVTIAGSLSYENQKKIANTYREARGRTDGARTLDLRNKISFAKAEMSAGTWKGTKTDVLHMQKEVLMDDQNAGAAADAIMTHFLAEKAKTHENVPMVMALGLAGNSAQLAAMNISEEKMVEMSKKEWARLEMSSDYQFDALSKMATEYGNRPAAKAMGEVLSSTARGWSWSGEMSIENAAAMTKTMATLRILQDKGKEGVMDQLYSGMPVDDAVRIQRLMAFGKQTDAKGARDKLLELERSEANMSGSDKAVAVANMSKAVAEAQSGITDRGAFFNLLATLNPFSGSMEKISPTSSWFARQNNSSEAINDQVSMVKDAHNQELKEFMSTRPANTDPQLAADAATQAVLRRTIKTSSGNVLVVPKGYTPQEYFGSKQQPLTASPEQLSKAMDMITPKLSADGRIVYSVNGDNLRGTEYNDQGVPTGNVQLVSKADVAKAVQMQMDKEVSKVNKSDGFGIPVKMNGTVLHINGENAAGMSNKSMVAVREHLSKFEGFTVGIQKDVGERLGPDGKPVMTTGVGISSTNTFFKDLKADSTPEEHLQAFRNATDEAARDALKLTSALGKKGEAWKILSTELIYQSGAHTVRSVDAYQKLFSFNEVASTEHQTEIIVGKMQALIRETPAFKYSKAKGSKSTDLSPRQRHYLALAQSVALGE